MKLNFCLFCVLISFSLIECQQKMKKSGEEIADQLYKHPKECKEPNDGGIWAPLAAGHPCGPPGHDCNYPDQWCSARSSSRSVPQLNCVNLPDECKKALQADDANSTASTAGKPTKTTSSPTPTKTTTEFVASTKATKHRTTTTEEPQTTESDDIETTTVEDISEETETTRRTAKPRNRASAKSGGRHAPIEDSEGGASAEVAAPTEKPAEPSCKDSSDLCCFWASNLQQAGTECNRNALWMRTNCQKSCGTCGCQASNFQSCQVKVNVEGCKYLQGSSNNVVVVPIQNRGNGNFNFPTVGGNQGPVVVPVGRSFNSFNSGFQQSQRFQNGQGQNGRVVVPLRSG